MANIFIFLYFTVINKSAKYDKLRKYTAQKIKFSIKDFFSKCDQIRSKLRIWPNLLKKSLMENFIFSAVILVILHSELCHN